MTSSESEDHGQLFTDIQHYCLWPVVELDVVLPASTLTAYFMAFMAGLVILNMH